MKAGVRKQKDKKDAGDGKKPEVYGDKTDAQLLKLFSK